MGTNVAGTLAIIAVLGTAIEIVSRDLAKNIVELMKLSKED